MPQEFRVQQLAPTSGAAAFGEAIFTSTGVSCYGYVGYVDMPQIAFDEFEKRWTEFLHGLNTIKQIVSQVPPATP